MNELSSTIVHQFDLWIFDERVVNQSQLRRVTCAHIVPLVPNSELVDIPTTSSERDELTHWLTSENKHVVVRCGYEQ